MLLLAAVLPEQDFTALWSFWGAKQLYIRCASSPEGSVVLPLKCKACCSLPGDVLGRTIWGCTSLPHSVREGKVVSAPQVGKLRNRLSRQPAAELGLCAALPVTDGANPPWRQRLPELPGGPDTSPAVGAGWWEGRAELYASCLQLG